MNYGAHPLEVGSSITENFPVYFCGQRSLCDDFFFVIVFAARI